MLRLFTSVEDTRLFKQFFSIQFLQPVMQATKA